MSTRESIVIGAIIVICVAFALWLLPARKVVYSDNSQLASAIASTSTLATTTLATTTSPIQPPFVITHIPTPDPVKAAYFTSWAAGTASFQNEMYALLDGSTELNSVVIDVKDYSGRIGYVVDDPRFKDPLIDAVGSAENRIPDVERFIGTLHAKGVYVIGRIQAFEDPFVLNVHPDWYVLDSRTGKPWRDAGGAYWMDPDSEGVWSYISAIAKQAYAVGFDEINFDYMRFPSDGDVSDTIISKSASTTKAEVIESFFSYLHDQLSSIGIPISVDLFGQTTSDTGDMGIGQVIEDAFPYFDFVDPMVYPSHYVNGFQGYAKPALHPYEIVKYAMDQGVIRAVAASSTPSKLRPWLQAFDFGAVYTPAMVDAQKQATYDAGLNGWLLWNAGAIYNKAELVPMPASTTQGML